MKETKREREKDRKRGRDRGEDTSGDRYFISQDKSIKIIKNEYGNGNNGSAYYLVLENIDCSTK